MSKVVAMQPVEDIGKVDLSKVVAMQLVGSAGHDIGTMWQLA